MAKNTGQEIVERATLRKSDVSMQLEKTPDATTVSGHAGFPITGEKNAHAASSINAVLDLFVFY